MSYIPDPSWVERVSCDSDYSTCPYKSVDSTCEFRLSLKPVYVQKYTEWVSNKFLIKHSSICQGFGVFPKAEFLQLSQTLDYSSINSFLALGHCSSIPLALHADEFYLSRQIEITLDGDVLYLVADNYRNRPIIPSDYFMLMNSQPAQNANFTLHFSKPTTMESLEGYTFVVGEECTWSYRLFSKVSI